MGDGNIDVGNKTRNRKPGLAVVESLANTDSPSALRPRICRAMLQQGARPGLSECTDGCIVQVQ